MCGLEIQQTLWLTAQSHLHSAKTHHTQLKMTSTQNLALFLIFVLCKLELQLSLVAMVFAHSETGSSELKKNRIYDAESPSSQFARIMWQQNHCFLFHLLKWPCLLHNMIPTSRESYLISVVKSVKSSQV